MSPLSGMANEKSLTKQMSSCSTVNLIAFAFALSSVWIILKPVTQGHQHVCVAKSQLALFCNLQPCADLAVCCLQNNTVQIQSCITLRMERNWVQYSTMKHACKLIQSG